MIGAHVPEAIILTRSERHALPPVGRLEAVARHLAAGGEHRSLIRFIEGWSRISRPTALARRLQVDAFLHLRLTDRAWVRLRQLTEDDPDDAQAWILTARMFQLRGWPQRARTALEHARALDPEEPSALALQQQLITSPTRSLPELEAVAEEPAALIRYAERAIATGALLNAHRALERCLRLEPEQERAAELLWGLEGDFQLPDESLSAAARRLGPSLAALAEPTDDIEHTESLGRRDTPLGEEVGGSSEAFPALFRAVTGEQLPAEPTEPSAEPEVTRSAALQTLRRAPSAGPTPLEPTDLPTDPAAIPGGDTEILHVLHRSEGSPRKTEGSIHQGEVEMPGAGFDLAAFRREMGMSDAEDLLDDLSPDLEEEDDELIILTGRDGRRAPASAPRLPADAQAEAQAEAEEARLGSPIPAPSPITPIPPDPTPARHPRTPSTSWWLISVGIVLWLAAAFLLATVLIRLAAS